MVDRFGCRDSYLEYSVLLCVLKFPFARLRNGFLLTVENNPRHNMEETHGEEFEPPLLVHFTRWEWLIGLYLDTPIDC